MKLPDYHRALICAALECFEAQSEQESDAIAETLYALGAPYAPHRTASDWRLRSLSSPAP